MQKLLKTALVTGDASGIGRASSIAFANAGTNVFITPTTTPESQSAQRPPPAQRTRSNTNTLGQAGNKRIKRTAPDETNWSVGRSGKRRFVVVFR